MSTSRNQSRRLPAVSKLKKISCQQRGPVVRTFLDVRVCASIQFARTAPRTQIPGQLEHTEIPAHILRSRAGRNIAASCTGQQSNCGARRPGRPPRRRAREFGEAGSRPRSVCLCLKGLFTGNPPLIAASHRPASLEYGARRCCCNSRNSRRRRSCCSGSDGKAR